MTGQNDPIQIAAEFFKQLGDVDQNTAITALTIAQLLITHREASINDFSNELVSADSKLLIEDSSEGFGGSEGCSGSD